MSDMEYVYAVARIRVKEKSLLSDADIRQMTAMKSEKEILQFLTDRGWGAGDGSESADLLLDTETEKNRKMLREMKVAPGVQAILFFPQLYHNLKAGIREVCAGEERDLIYYESDELPASRVRRILRDQAFGDLPSHMIEAAREAYDAMVRTRDGQRCDNIIDRACLTAMLEAGKKSHEPMVEDYVQSRVAVTDIRIAARAQKTGKSLAFLREALAPCRAFETEALARAAVKGEEALTAYLSAHGYREAAEALSESQSAFERWCDDQLIETIKPQKTNSLSVGPIVAYYLARENEIRTARIILTAKANDFTEEEIQERVRKMYV